MEYQAFEDSLQHEGQRLKEMQGKKVWKKQSGEWGSKKTWRKKIKENIYNIIKKIIVSL